MNTKGIDVKERIRAVIVDCHTRDSATWSDLHNLLADLEAEPPKPTGETANTFFPECANCTRQYEKWCSYFESKQTCDYKQYLANKCVPFVPEPPKPTVDFETALTLAKGCHDYNGGHSGEKHGAYHHGIDTVINVLEGAKKKWDLQVATIYQVGKEKDQAEPPKPTSEQLKANEKAFCADEPTACVDLDVVWDDRIIPGCEIIVVDKDYPRLRSLIGKLRWHLKDAPTQLALMICNHAGECKVAGCHHAVKHLRQDACKILCQNKNGGIAGSVCVPLVEPVVHFSCEGCNGSIRNGTCSNCLDPSLKKDGGWLRRNWTPKQPEPAAPVKSCEDCKYQPTGGIVCVDCNDGKTLIHRNWTPKEPEPVAQKAIRVPGFGYIPKGVEPVVKENFTAVEPKAEPGLVSYTIKEKYGHWRVCYSGGITQPIDEAFCQIIFHHIELKSGATVTTLSAFAENDPPIAAWFRK